MAETSKTTRGTVGKRSGLDPCAAWSKAFVENEKKKMTDEELQAYMHKDFPWSKADLYTDVSHVQRRRLQYNRGLLSEDGKAPKVQSHKWAADGTEFKRSGGGRPKGSAMKAGKKAGKKTSSKKAKSGATSKKAKAEKKTYF